jgi:hypothetical protein
MAEDATLNSLQNHREFMADFVGPALVGENGTGFTFLFTFPQKTGREKVTRGRMHEARVDRKK